MVDRGNAFVFERISVKIATAVVNGTPENQPSSLLVVHGREARGKMCSTIDPTRFPGGTLRNFPKALQRTRGGSMRREDPSSSNLHPFIILPFNLLQRHPSRRGERTDQRISTSNSRRITPAVWISLCFRRWEYLLGKDFRLLRHGTCPERPGFGWDMVCA